ncbi:hypothetical protein BJ944DRAFT_80060 [Cunninghamella echinulata]|nr:hypothetical protein BJ944DRAFT_80060 [Cunninghamella echinulata]
MSLLLKRSISTSCRVLSTLSTEIKESIAKKAIKSNNRKPNLDKVQDVLIPGQYLRYFKPAKTRNTDQQGSTNTTKILNVYTESARTLKGHEFDNTPTIAQERLAQCIHRALSTVYSIEVLPSPLITLSHISIRQVKASRNLKKCFIFYEPTSTNKATRGKVHRALLQYKPLLTTHIKNHSQLRKPPSIQFISDTESKELDAIFEKLEIQLKNHDE